MLKQSLILCSLALASCAMNPPVGGAAAASNNEHHVAGPPRIQCDRIKVICIDANVPGALMPSLGVSTLTIPALPNVLTLPR